MAIMFRDRVSSVVLARLERGPDGTITSVGAGATEAARRFTAAVATAALADLMDGEGMTEAEAMTVLAAGWSNGSTVAREETG